MKQETSVTQYYAQIVGLSEGYCQKACNFKGKSRFKNLKSCHRCPNANAKFHFFFGIKLGVLVLRHTDNSSSTLRYTHMYMSYYKAQ